jgi:hypothetical protein
MTSIWLDSRIAVLVGARIVLDAKYSSILLDHRVGL